MAIATIKIGDLTGSLVFANRKPLDKTRWLPLRMLVWWKRKRIKIKQRHREFIMMSLCCVLKRVCESSMAWSVRWCVKAKYFYGLSKHIYDGSIILFSFLMSKPSETWQECDIWRPTRRQWRQEEVQYINLDPFVYITHIELSAYARIPHTCRSLFEKYMVLLSTEGRILTYAQKKNNNQIDDSNCNGKNKFKCYVGKPLV